MIRVSVLMTAYNEEKYIAEAIKSVLNQTMENWELIIVNDASTDKTGEIANRYAKDSRIELINLEKNTGQLKALNKGLDKARGKYVVFLDADDLMNEKRLKEQSEFMEKRNLDFSYCDAYFLEKGKRTEIKALNSDIDLKKILKKKSKEGFDMKKLPGFHLWEGQGKEKDRIRTVFGGEFMIKRNIIEEEDIKFDENLVRMGDHDLWFQAIGHDLKIERFPKPYFIYRRHGGQKSEDEAKMLKAAKYINRKLKVGKYFK